MQSDNYLLAEKFSFKDQWQVFHEVCLGSINPIRYGQIFLPLPIINWLNCINILSMGALKHSQSNLSCALTLSAWSAGCSPGILNNQRNYQQKANFGRGHRLSSFYKQQDTLLGAKSRKYVKMRSKSLDTYIEIFQIVKDP